MESGSRETAVSEGPVRTTAATRKSRYLVLAAMIFAVSMTFIDQTIVSIAGPQIRSDLGLSITGLQWAVNAYLLAMAALFAFGGRLSDILGHRRMVVFGVVVFAAASAMCGLTPTSSALSTPWIVTFRILQGAGGAVMYPAALAIVVSSFHLRERGQALAAFFGIAGVFTAVGPIVGGFLAQWTWRAIFWINIPIAVIAVVLTLLSTATTVYRPARLDYPGLVLVASGVALSVFGFQQSANWGWSHPVTGLSVAAGVFLLVAFVVVESRTSTPLVRVDIFRIRAFLVENIVLALSMVVFVPLFLFASEYAQVCLGRSANQTWIILVYYFLGFAVSAQLGGRMLDRTGVKPTVVTGCALAAAGFALWAGTLTELDLGSQRWFVVLTGFGMGLVLGPVSTDAVNHASQLSYGEVVGVTQTVRNYAGSLGLAILGAVLVSVTRARLTSSLVNAGIPRPRAARQVVSLSQSGGAPTGRGPTSIPHFVRLDFASATEFVFYIMAALMALAAVVALFGLESGPHRVNVVGLTPTRFTRS